MGSPNSGAGDHVTKNMEKSMFLITFYALVFTDKICLQESWAPEKVWNKDDLPLVEEDQVREHLNRLEIQKSMGSDRMQLCVLMELANATVRSLLIIFGKS